MKEWLRQRFPFHREEGFPPILVVGTPRGGTTWLAELLVCAPGFRFVQEPLNLRLRSVREASGLSEWRELWERDADRKLLPYLRRIVVGELRHRDTFLIRRPRRFGGRWRTNRTLLKLIHGATSHLDALANELGAEVVHLVRHPIATAVSREVFPSLDSFPGSWASERIPARARGEAERIVREGDHLEKGVLAWSLHHYPLFRWERGERFHRLSYEELVLDPLKNLRSLAARLRIPVTSRMEKAIRLPSLSAGKSSPAQRRAIRDPEQAQARLGSWREAVSASKETSLLEIAERFGIGLYRPGEILPRFPFPERAGSPVQTEFASR